MKIDSAAVSGRRGGFETRPYTGAVGRNHFFLAGKVCLFHLPEPRVKGVP